MSYKLFIDDERWPIDDGTTWVIARSSADAITAVECLGVPEYISYDHDLGGDDTSIKFIWWLINAYLDKKITTFPINYYVHSQNPVGAENIRSLLFSFIESEVK
jgi:hypothetical protein